MLLVSNTLQCPFSGHRINFGLCGGTKISNAELEFQLRPVRSPLPRLIVFLNTKQRKRAGSGVKLHLFLISILVGSEQSASRGARVPDSGPRSRCGLEEQTLFPACRQPLADR